MLHGMPTVRTYTNDVTLNVQNTPYRGNRKRRRHLAAEYCDLPSRLYTIGDHGLTGTKKTMASLHESPQYINIPTHPGIVVLLVLQRGLHSIVRRHIRTVAEARGSTAEEPHARVAERLRVRRPQLIVALAHVLPRHDGYPTTLNWGAFIDKATRA